MDKNQMFCIINYISHYSPGGIVYCEDTSSNIYVPESSSTFMNKIMFFNSKDEVFSWLCKSTGQELLLKIFLVEYIKDFNGVKDVIKINNLTNGKENYYTAINKENITFYLKEESENFKITLFEGNPADIYRTTRECGDILRPIYYEFIKRGIRIDYILTYDKKNKKRNKFTIKDNTYMDDIEAAIKEGKLIIYNPTHLWYPKYKKDVITKPETEYDIKVKKMIKQMGFNRIDRNLRNGPRQG